MPIYQVVKFYHTLGHSVAQGKEFNEWDNPWIIEKPAIKAITETTAGGPEIQLILKHE